MARAITLPTWVRRALGRQLGVFLQVSICGYWCASCAHRASQRWQSDRWMKAVEPIYRTLPECMVRTRATWPARQSPGAPGMCRASCTARHAAQDQALGGRERNPPILPNWRVLAKPPKPALGNQVGPRAPPPFLMSQHQDFPHHRGTHGCIQLADSRCRLQCVYYGVWWVWRIAISQMSCRMRRASRGHRHV